MTVQGIGVLAVVLVLTGCASNPGVVAMGPDTYFVSRQAATAFVGLGGLKTEALREAGQFCASKGKTAEVVHESNSKPPFILGNYPRTDIQFRCT